VIITRTPFRISFFGGGTDYPVYYRENGGAVLATTINRYCYINLRYLPPFFEYKNRIVYRKIEQVSEIDQIIHPSVRECLRYMAIEKGLEIHHDGDLPARSGLGSSSSFTVGLLHALFALQGKMVSKLDLAETAIHVEQNLIKENVGSQDQTMVAFGGFKKILFNGPTGQHLQILPLTVKKERIEDLENNLMLFFTGFARNASEIAGEQIKETPNKKRELAEMRCNVDEATNILTCGRNIDGFGRLLHENWMIKRSLTDKITTSAIDDMYEKARKFGAIGGKLLGAGSGGFMLFFVKPENQVKLRENLGMLHVPFRFENGGSQVIFYEMDPK
jgi:D-glycero-alpha-D-manno-heptose-7-phosphate kinase